MDEIIDVFDEFDEPTGKTVRKDLAHRTGSIHRVAHLWLYKPGFVLLQKRSLQKKAFSGCWDVAVAGHVGAGEGCADAVVREAREELGLDIKRGALSMIGVFRTSFEPPGLRNNEFMHVYCAGSDADAAKLKLQAEEVDEVRWFSFDAARKMAELGREVIPHGRHYFKYCVEWLANLKE